MVSRLSSTNKFQIILIGMSLQPLRVDVVTSDLLSSLVVRRFLRQALIDWVGHLDRVTRARWLSADVVI